MNPGERLGPYEIIAPLGAGGMGEVYRARDTRLGREVAIKVLSAEFARDPDRLRRFEQEARAVAALNHPNILALYDVGTAPLSFRAGGEESCRAGSPDQTGSSPAAVPYLVTELLEGESLRDRLQGGAIPVRKAVDIGIQIAHGLAAAHEKGIIHRDLKPGNVFLTKDGQVKILDFGLAKPASGRAGRPGEATTVMEATEAGVVLGTVGYMSPEQVRGQTVDHRTDVFALGCVLYEVLAGSRPFQRASAPETMAAILNEEPPDLIEIGRSISPGLGRIVQHCVEKEPSSRFQSARDVAFALESLSQSTTGVTAPLRSNTGWRRWTLAGLGAVLLAASYVGVFLWTKRAVSRPVPTFTRLTFRRGVIGGARFTPDGQSVVYFARWGERPWELFVQRLGSPNARSLGTGFVVGRIHGIAGGEAAVLREDRTLVVLPLEGGTPREVVKEVLDAAWDPSGSRFAILRVVAGRQRLEYPVGKVLLETTHFLRQLRFSPDGTRIGFVERDEKGKYDICEVDLSGRKRTLAKVEDTGTDQCWSPDGNEIWFSAGHEKRLALHAVTLAGRERLVGDLPGNFVIRDIAPDGRVLVSFGPPWRWETRGRMAGDTAERDLSWLDGTFVSALSPDGSQFIFTEESEGGGSSSCIYHWRTENPSPGRLGSGHSWGASPDWTTVLAWEPNSDGEEIKLVPVGAGESRTLPRGSIRTYAAFGWSPDGKRVVILGRDADARWRLFVQDVAGGDPRSIASLTETSEMGPLSHDGRYVAARPQRGEPFAFFPIAGGEPRPIPFLHADEQPLVFSDDGMSLFVAKSSGRSSRRVATQIVRLSLKDGRQEPWLELVPPDQAGVDSVASVVLTRDGRFYAYSYNRILRDLYVVRGLR